MFTQEQINNAKAWAKDQGFGDITDQDAVWLINYIASNDPSYSGKSQPTISNPNQNNSSSSETNTSTNNTTNANTTNTTNNTNTTNTSTSGTSTTNNSSIINNTKTDSNNTINGTTTEEQTPIVETPKEGNTINISDKEDIEQQTQSPSENVSDNNIKSDTDSNLENRDLSQSLYDRYIKTLSDRFGQDKIDQIVSGTSGEDVNDEDVQEVVSTLNKGKANDLSGNLGKLYEYYENSGDTADTFLENIITGKYGDAILKDIGLSIPFIRSMKKLGIFKNISKKITKFKKVLNKNLGKGRAGPVSYFTLAAIGNILDNAYGSARTYDNNGELIGDVNIKDLIKNTNPKDLMTMAFSPFGLNILLPAKGVSNYEATGKIANSDAWNTFWKKIGIGAANTADTLLLSVPSIIRDWLDKSEERGGRGVAPRKNTEKEQRKFLNTKHALDAYEKSGTYNVNNILDKLPKDEGDLARAQVYDAIQLLNYYGSEITPEALLKDYIYDMDTHTWYNKKNGASLFTIMQATSNAMEEAMSDEDALAAYNSGNGQ